MRIFVLLLAALGLSGCFSVDMPFQDYGTFKFGFAPNPDKLAQHGIRLHPALRDK